MIFRYVQIYSDSINTYLERFRLFQGIYSTYFDSGLDNNIRTIGISMVVGILDLDFSDIEISNFSIGVCVRNVEI